jgi:hypothetical protein
MKARHASLIGSAGVAITIAAASLWSGERNPPSRDGISAAAREEIKSVELEIDRVEAESQAKHDRHRLISFSSSHYSAR